MSNSEEQIKVAYMVKADLENFLNGGVLRSEYRCQLGYKNCDNCPLNKNKDWAECNESHDKPAFRLDQINKFFKNQIGNTDMSNFQKIQGNSDMYYKQEIERKEDLILTYQKELSNQDKTESSLVDENNKLQEQVFKLEKDLREFYDFKFEVSLDCLPWPVVRAVCEYDNSELQTTEDIVKQVWVWRNNIVAGNAVEGKVYGKYFTVFKNKVIFTYSYED